MGTIWRALFKPPLIVSRASSAIRPELASRRLEHGLPIRMSLYIYLLPMLIVYRFLWPPRFMLLLVCCLYKEVYYNFLMCVLLIARLLRGVGRWVRKPINHTSWVAVVTPTDRPKSVRNRCIIELFVALFVLSLYPFDNSVGIGAFVIGLSQISSFFT